MNDYKTLCVISEWIDGELTEALKVSDQTHKVNRHIIAFLKRKLREIDNHIYTYEKAFDRFSIDDLNRFFEYDTLKIERVTTPKNKATN